MERMKDPRIPLHPVIRNTGFAIGILMMIAGLIIGWRQSGMSAVLPPTGYRK
jgi:hypothetical protein